MEQKVYEATREGLIQKLNDELDELVTESVTGNKSAQAQLITANAPTIDNCIEIIFAISEYGDNLELTEADYEKLVGTDHTLLALSERYLSSDYHTGNSEAIVNFLNSFVKGEDINKVSLYGQNEYDFILSRTRIIKQKDANSDFVPLDFRETFFNSITLEGYSVEQPAPGETIYKIKQNNEETVIAHLLPDNSFFTVPGSDNLESKNYLVHQFSSIKQSVKAYNNSFPFPDNENNKRIIEQGYRIVDMCNDTVLAAKKGTHSPVKFVVWDYDRVNGGCNHGDYYETIGYEYARDGFLQRAFMDKPMQHTVINYETLDMLVHNTNASEDMTRLYDEYDRQTKLKLRDFAHYYGNGYPISFSDAELLLDAPGCLRSGIEIYRVSDVQQPLNSNDLSEIKYLYDDNAPAYINLCIKVPQDERMDFERLKREYLLPINYYNELLCSGEYSEEYALSQAISEQEYSVSPYRLQKYQVAEYAGKEMLYSDKQITAEVIPDFLNIYYTENGGSLISYDAVEQGEKIDQSLIGLDNPWMMTMGEYLQHNINSSGEGQGDDLFLYEDKSRK